MTRPTDDRVPILNATPATASTSSRGKYLLVGVATLLACASVAMVASVAHRPAVDVRRALPRNILPILTPNPIIGIHGRISFHGDEYIGASYIKWVESAGGRAVHIPYDASPDELRALLHNVNGVLFPGGGGDPNAAATFIYEYAMELNDNGTYFPIWGTCLGLEWLVQLTSKNASILDVVEADNVSSTLAFQHRDDRPPSRIFGFSPFFDVLTTAPLTDNFHDLGILADHFDATESLAAFYNPVATSQDRHGQTYVAVIEAYDYPFYGVQFHPEKNAYEFGEFPDGRLWKWIDHSYEAILASQSFAHFFLHEARRNDHWFRDIAQQQAALLYNTKTSNRSYPMYVEIVLVD
ncbi:Aste57867_20658 [Aphanomyces stellatus]|uniref:folate gamma-glutamyl hydrolase n=1 Tax=Aphanomyces stellatus TaxID=120398 RepID=A0A485LFL6_9STRA|nr:hypothetical protein As57867_020590 [Aphanomyces stellatus]VFT97338.1 Aste57867_20658 [Aphanomyces stellatus]